MRPQAEQKPPSVHGGKHSASMGFSLRREQMTEPLPGSGHCAHMKKLCAVVLPHILLGPAVVGSCAAREREDA